MASSPSERSAVLAQFHPAVARWFERTLGVPTEPQAQGWPSIQAGNHTLIAAPTGSGKTLSAFLAAIDDLIRRGLAGTLSDETHVLYISPLKALSNDIEKNLRFPLEGIQHELGALGLPTVELRAFVRTGDTSPKDRAKALKRPPHIYVTTPESMYILLTTEKGREMLKTVSTVIVDEIHALVKDKRGSHLALSLERLDALTGRKVTRIGLSATQKPLEDIAHFLTGVDDNAPVPCTVIDTGHQRPRDLAIEVTGSPVESVISGEVWEEIYDRLALLVQAHKSTLVFVNTRRLAERVAKHLGTRLGEGQVMSHHGSLSRETRLNAEQHLKGGQLRALVATSSLELGIDVGAVDLVCQIGSTRSIATFLQRVGRSGHSLAGTPKGRLFPLSRDEMVESVALLDAIRRGELDRVTIPEAPLDILAQQLAATVANEEWDEDALFALVRRAYPYRNLTRARFDEVVGMLSDGFATARGRRAAHLHRDIVNHKLRARRGTRLIAVTCGGAIPDNADYEVIQEPGNTFVGTINEDFAIESMAGDIFQLGTVSWRILRVEPGRVRVEDAQGKPPTLPFWLGEAPSRTPELSHSVSHLRAEVERRGDASRAWMTDELGVAPAVADQVADYLLAACIALGSMPTQQNLVVERFFDEGGGMQLVIHAPFGSRLNRAWGLALRKKFCQRFNFELQAAATEDAIVLSLGPTHSFPLEDIFRYLRSTNVRDVLSQALLDAPMFGTRWRWNASRALAILRFRNGKKRPPRFLRMDADDLLTLVFPDQVACAENLTGPPVIPDHPLVAQTMSDCLVEAMDIDALEALLRSMEAGERTLVARDVTEPSPLAQEILNASPYAFLDDAPLEERRTQAVQGRRFLDPNSASDLGALDPAAIARVREEAWPDPESEDELHDALLVTGALSEEEGRASAWTPLFDGLVKAKRAYRLITDSGAVLWIAAERAQWFDLVHPAARRDPARPALVMPDAPQDRDKALKELVRGRLEASGPTAAADMAARLALPVTDIDQGLIALEVEGFAIRGKFTAEATAAAATPIEWCDRRLLARIHRYTLDRLRSEIQPVSPQDFMRFLFAWHRVTGDTPAEGQESVRLVLSQLEGFESAASAWEKDILPARVKDFEPAWLDAMCLSGLYTWGRVGSSQLKAGPVKSTPITWMAREHLPDWAHARKERVEPASLSQEAQTVLDALTTGGALFFGEVLTRTKLLRAQAEVAMAELVSLGFVASDSPAGLRTMVTPASKRVHPLRRRAAAQGMEHAGRWSLLNQSEPVGREAYVETFAEVLLRRYGVVFRKLLERESLAPTWRELVMVYRRMEMRGDLRGGRFVTRFSGEQYALPEAVTLLRSVRKEPLTGELVSITAADPLNLVGIVTTGDRVTAIAKNRVLFRDGEPLAVSEGSTTKFLAELETSERWALEKALAKGVRAA